LIDTAPPCSAARVRATGLSQILDEACCKPVRYITLPAGKQQLAAAVVDAPELPSSNCCAVFWPVDNRGRIVDRWLRANRRATADRANGSLSSHPTESVNASALVGANVGTRLHRWCTAIEELLRADGWSATERTAWLFP